MAVRITIPMEKRFDRFVRELEKLSVKYGVVVQAIGGVTIFNEEDFRTLKKVTYSKDPSSGDLEPKEIV